MVKSISGLVLVFPYDVNAEWGLKLRPDSAVQ